MTFSDVPPNVLHGIIESHCYLLFSLWLTMQIILKVEKKDTLIIHRKTEIPILIIKIQIKINK
jgi:hypothetical protein